MNFKPFFSALRFLTILPIPESWCGDEDDFYRSPDWYPVVGLGIGLGLAILDLFLCWLLPIQVASILLVLAMIMVSGALHLDGLADSADAFFSSRGREQMLEIMKDSRSGPMGGDGDCHCSVVEIDVAGFSAGRVAMADDSIDSSCRSLFAFAGQ